MKASDGGRLGVEVTPSLAMPGRISLDAANDLTPAEARRVAAALVKEAEKAEKKGRKK